MPIEVDVDREGVCGMEDSLDCYYYRLVHILL